MLLPVRALARAAVVLIVAGSALIPALPAAAATYSPPALRQRVDLNSGWKFTKGDVANAQSPTFNDSAWASVNTPHTWNATDGSDGGNNYYRGVGWYRRHYTVPAGYAGKQLYLQFAGANQVADVYVNGTYLGQHAGGYARFRFNATSAFHVGQDNVIAVKVNNANNANIPPLSRRLHVRRRYLPQRQLLGGRPAADPHARLRRARHLPAPAQRHRELGDRRRDDQGVQQQQQRRQCRGPHGHRRRRRHRRRRPDADRRQCGRSRRARRDPDRDHRQPASLGRPGRPVPLQRQRRDARRHRPTGSPTWSPNRSGCASFAIDVNTGFTLNGHDLDLHGVNLHQDRAGVGWAVDDAAAHPGLRSHPRDRCAPPSGWRTTSTTRRTTTWPTSAGLRGVGRDPAGQRHHRVRRVHRQRRSSSCAS